MTVPYYQANGVGRAAAAGPGQSVAGFVTAPPGSNGAFSQAGVFNNANIMEYTNGQGFVPGAYIPLR